MPQWRADEEIYFSAIRITYYILRPKRKEQENTTKMHAARFKMSPLHSAFKDNKVKKNGLMGHA